MPAYKRVLLKLSGEAFGGGQVGVDPDVVIRVAQQIAEVVSRGVQVAIVVGGGNFSAAPSCSSVEWTVTGPITWACSGRS